MLGKGIKSVKAIVVKAIERTVVTRSRVRMMAKCLNQGWISLTTESESES